MIKRLLALSTLIAFLLVSFLPSPVYADSEKDKLENLPDGKVKWTGLVEMEYGIDPITLVKTPKCKWDNDKKFLYKEKAYLKAKAKYDAGEYEVNAEVPEPKHFKTKTFEIVTGKSLNSSSQIRGASDKAKQSIASKFGQVGDFIWVDGVNEAGTIILPDSNYDHVYLATGDWANPVIAEIYNYEIIDGKTHIHVDHFSGGGGVHETGKRMLWYQPNAIVTDNQVPNRAAFATGFDGNSSRILMADTGLDLLSTLTYEVWTMPFDGGDSYGRILSKTNANPYGTREVMLGKNADDETDIRFEVTTTGTPLHSGTGSMTVDAWNHIVCTAEVSAPNITMYIYSNGSQVATQTVAGSIATTAGGAFWVGALFSTNQNFFGLIDEVRVYDRVLELPEIQANYNAGVGTYTATNTTGIVGWWHMDEGDGTSVTDFSGQGNTGTRTGGFWATGHVPRNAGDSNDNPAAITWGNLPAGVTATLGGLISDYSSTYITGTSTQDIAPVTTPPIITTDVVKRAVLATDPFISGATALEAASNNRLPVLLQYWWAYLALSVILFVAIYAKFPNLIIAGIAFCIPIGYGISQGIIDWYVMAALILWLIGCIAMERGRVVG